MDPSIVFRALPTGDEAEPPLYEPYRRPPMTASEVETYFSVEADDIPDFDRLFMLRAFDVLRDQPFNRRYSLEQLKGKPVLVGEEARRLWKEHEDKFLIGP